MEERIARQTDAVSEDLVEVLTRRGITRASARELAARWPMRILPQIAIYDWLRQGDTTEPRYHPGRLRRMIEEDWTPPPGFLARAERRAARRVMDLTGEGGAPASLADTAEPGDVLARQLGVHAVDQGVWQALIGSRPGFPPFLRLALFCPPPPGTRIAAVIFLDEQARARGEALSPAVKGRLAMLIAARYRLPFVEVVFFTRAALLAQLHAGGGSAGSVHPREPGDPVAGAGIQQSAGASRGSIGGREE